MHKRKTTLTTKQYQFNLVHFNDYTTTSWSSLASKIQLFIVIVHSTQRYFIKSYYSKKKSLNYSKYWYQCPEDIKPNSTEAEIVGSSENRE